RDRAGLPRQWTWKLLLAGSYLQRAGLAKYRVFWEGEAPAEPRATKTARREPRPPRRRATRPQPRSVLVVLLMRRRRAPGPGLVQLQQPGEQVVVKQVRWPAVGDGDRLVERPVGVRQP